MSTTIKPRSVLLASYNQHKALEIQAIAGQELTITTLSSKQNKIHWEEIGESFEENAKIKAHAVLAQLQGPILADDSGLIVHALGGRPGVHSSSFCGKEGDDLANIKKLLEEMANVPIEDRTAAFVCCLLYISEAGRESVFFGHCSGRIGLRARGQNGFGYDPVFIPDGFDKSFAELGPEIKNSLSHRKAALEKWREFMQF